MAHGTGGGECHHGKAHHTGYPCRSLVSTLCLYRCPRNIIPHLEQVRSIPRMTSVELLKQQLMEVREESEAAVEKHRTHIKRETSATTKEGHDLLRYFTAFVRLDDITFQELPCAKGSRGFESKNVLSLKLMCRVLHAES